LEEVAHGVVGGGWGGGGVTAASRAKRQPQVGVCTAYALLLPSC
jgi:hypothetical protein